MGLSVKLDLPQYPPDAQLGVAGLGTVENGGTIEVDEEMENSFLSAQGRTVEQGFEGQAGVEVSGSGTVEPPPEPEVPPEEGEPEPEPEPEVPPTEE